MSGQTKVILTWLTGALSMPAMLVFPDMASGHAPTPEHLWQALAASLVGMGLVNMKKPSEHKDDN